MARRNSKMSTQNSDKLRAVLKKIYPQEVTLNEVEGERKKILRDLLFQFKLYCLKSCPIFELLFKEYFYTGSAFEGLQVKEPVEFDVDVVLELPFMKYGSFEEAEKPLSFGTFQLNQPLKDLDRYSNGKNWSCLARFFDQNNYLIGQEVLSWLQSLLDRCFNSKDFEKPACIEKIKTTNSGPARTLELKVGYTWLYVDLVPVFLMTCKDRYLPHVSLLEEIVPCQFMSRCFLVPKPLKDAELYQLTANESSRMWRIHFAKAELQILDKRKSLKPVIKLVKRLRDKESWPIPSYFIKTVAFWIVVRHPDPDYFEECFFGVRFLEMLETLGNYIQNGHLGHIFYPDFNLLTRLNSKALSPISDRIKKIVSELNKNPSSAKAIFRYRKSSP